ncbi:MAG: response regulator [Magnetococcales bacterium]|nr:response regulator [Magnetococcales bacterium]
MNSEWMWSKTMANQPAKPSILVVDDTPENLDVLKGVLRDRYMVRPAINGALALKLAAKDPQPDLILLDIMMPEMDGYEVCRRLKESPRTKDIPIIFVTAKAKVEDELKGLEMGAVDYIQKPISPPVVEARVKTQLSLRHANRELVQKNSRLYEINEKLTASLEQLSASEERFRSLVQTIPDIVYKIDDNGLFTFLNKAVERLGFHQSELIGQHFSQIIHQSDIPRSSREEVIAEHGPDTPQGEKKVFDERRTGLRMTAGLQIRLSSKSGQAAEAAEIKTLSEEVVHVEVNSSGLYETEETQEAERNRSYVGTVGVIRDITERIRIQERLRLAKEQAEEATRLKDKFVSLVAHDLRSPLSSMVGLLEYLSEDTENPLGKEQKSLICEAVKSGHNLTRMIEEVLNISRLKTGKITLEKGFFDGHYITTEILQRLEYLSQLKGVTLLNEVPGATRLHGDQTLFGEVIQNLVSNAIKFSKGGQTIRVFVPNGESTTIAVEDQGVGIPEGVVTKLFNVSEKVSTPGTDGEQGTGFGLPFSNDIMEAHNGQLTVRSVVGRGSVFKAYLPFVRPRIVVVDDDHGGRTMLKQALRPFQTELFEAVNGEEALALIREKRPHLVLTDIQMPRMDGFQLLDAMKKSPLEREIPVIVITVDKDSETRDRAFQLGAVDFATKPLELHDFLPRVRHLLGG